jgi:hypothetical protein
MHDVTGVTPLRQVEAQLCDNVFHPVRGASGLVDHIIDKDSALAGLKRRSVEGTAAIFIALTVIFG